MSKRLPFHVPTAADAEGPAIWRSLAEKAEPETRAAAATEEQSVQVRVRKDELLRSDALRKGKNDVLPEQSVVSRRQFLAVSGATAAAVGLSGCLRRPAENILPYSRAPEYSLPGVPLHFATATSHQGTSVGLIVESHEGRPTKIEGNPDHFGSLGATDAQVQAMILDLYDRDRLAHPLHNGGSGSAPSREPASWADFETWWRARDRALRANGGGRLGILMPPTDSPSMLRVRGLLRERFPQARLATWTPVSDSNARDGAQLAFTQPFSASIDYALPNVVVAVDCDFLGTEPGSIRNQRRFAEKRRMARASDTMSRLYVVEGTLSITGINADERLPLAPSRADAFLRALARALGVGGPIGQAVASATMPDVPERWLQAVVADLNGARGAQPGQGAAVVCVGRSQPAHVHALAHAINAHLGAMGRIVQLRPPVDREEPSNAASLGELVGAMNDGQVDTLVILGGNPVYDAPADLDFAEALTHVEHTVHLATHDDETSQRTSWHLPESHWLESWGDHVAADGTVSIQQPLTGTLRSSHSALEVLALLAGVRQWRGQHIVRTTMIASVGRPALERAWRQALHRGVSEVRAFGPTLGSLNLNAIVEALTSRAAPPPVAVQNGRPATWEVQFIPSYQTLDGRFANNPWMHEMPDPVTKLVWDNAAYISPASAEALELRDGDLLSISREGGGEVEIPAYRLPGQAPGVVALPLGFGRTHAGAWGNGVGFDVYPLRAADELGFTRALRVRKAAGHHELVVTQEHHSMEGRPLAIDATVEEYRNRADFPSWGDADHPGTPSPLIGPLWTQVDYTQPREPAQGGLSYALWPEQRPPREGAPPRHKWGFIVDLSTCTGCSACVVACQAENNIAVVGKQQVARGREMHWMRIDRYFLGDDTANPRVAVQPIACQHCEEAPCENVCPVNATAHSPEGINEMAYNRCIGTRYCLNNCPYKVRRFNFLDFHGDVDEMKQMQFNPNVTVRMRGVMEKCTYCVQRIQSARIRARAQTRVNAQGEIEERRIQDSEVVPACAQACPSGAIVFGDLNNQEGEPKRLETMDRSYKLLASIGTQPRTTFLGKIRNPNPAGRA
jgi:Fe-S-cluster-containing dehydrogenase component